MGTDVDRKCELDFMLTLTPEWKERLEKRPPKEAVECPGSYEWFTRVDEETSDLHILPGKCGEDEPIYTFVSRAWKKHPAGTKTIPVEELLVHSKHSPRVLQPLYVSCGSRINSHSIFSFSVNQSSDVYNAFPEIKRNKKKRSSRPSVLVVTLDSISRPAFHRTMPTVSGLLSRMASSSFNTTSDSSGYTAVELTKVHSVGRGTLENMGAFFYGNPNKWKPILNYPSLWDVAHENGYLTTGSSSTCRKGGKVFKFLESIPIYRTEEDLETSMTVELGKSICNSEIAAKLKLRPSEAPSLKLSTERCLGGRHLFGYTYDSLFEVWRHFRCRPREDGVSVPVYGHIKLNDAHESGWTKIYTLEKELSNFIKRFEALDSSSRYGGRRQPLLIIHADHGVTYGDFPVTTEAGRLEASLPITYILLPSWFKQEFRLATQHLISNRDKLITMYDFYHSLKFLFTGNEYSKRSVPLFSANFFEPVADRSCREAGIPSRTCVCVPWEEWKLGSLTSQEQKEVSLLSSSILTHINGEAVSFSKENSQYNTQCEVLEMDQLLSVRSKEVDDLFTEESLKKHKAGVGGWEEIAGANASKGRTFEVMFRTKSGVSFVSYLFVCLFCSSLFFSFLLLSSTRRAVLRRCLPPFSHPLLPFISQTDWFLPRALESHGSRGVFR